MPSDISREVKYSEGKIVLALEASHDMKLHFTRGFLNTGHIKRYQTYIKIVLFQFENVLILLKAIEKQKSAIIYYFNKRILLRINVYFNHSPLPHTAYIESRSSNNIFKFYCFLKLSSLSVHRMIIV